MLERVFYFNSVLVKLVPFHGQDVHPVTGIAFYVSNDGKYGVRVYPDGRKKLCNSANNTSVRTHTKEIYLQFKHPWNTNEQILAAHAVYIAWRGPIKEGMTIDHIDGCSTNNDYRNLRCISNAINNRDGGFLRILRNKGINTTTIPRWMLLRYYTRMATIKPSITRWRYEHLTKDELLMILYDANRAISNHFRTFYNIHISFPHVPST